MFGDDSPDLPNSKLQIVSAGNGLVGLQPINVYGAAKKDMTPYQQAAALLNSNLSPAVLGGLVGLSVTSLPAFDAESLILAMLSKPEIHNAFDAVGKGMTRANYMIELDRLVPAATPPTNLSGVDFSTFATGTDMIVSRPTMFKVAEVGTERVRVSPLGASHGSDKEGATIVFQGYTLVDNYSARRLALELRRVMNS